MTPDSDVTESKHKKACDAWSAVRSEIAMADVSAESPDTQCQHLQEQVAQREQELVETINATRALQLAMAHARNKAIFLQADYVRSVSDIDK